MKIEEAVEYMSLMYLERILKSFTQDYPSKKNEEEYREIIKNNVDTLSKPEGIDQRLNVYFSDINKDPYSNKLLYNFILRAVLSKPEFYSTKDEIIEDVIRAEQNIIKLSKDSDSFKHLSQKSIDIYSAILETALEDEVITNSELALLARLRKKLSISEKDQYLIQAKLGLFPVRDNKVHKPSEINEIIDDLQKCGILFYCNQFDNGSNKVYVIPQEMVNGVKSSLGVELIEDKYHLLLQKLQKKQLKEALRARNLNLYGTKDELIERIIHAGVKPTETLEYLTSKELSDVCSKIPSLNVSGTKDEKIQRLIDYYSKLIIKEFTEEDTGEKYFEYLEQLAERDLDNLLGNNIIKDADYIESAFEEGTRYLFNQVLNHELLKFNGSEHADGGVFFQNDNSLLLWDNKAKKDGTSYKFPDKHLRQFRRYIRNEASKGKRVNCFLIITSKIDQRAERNAVKLKAESGVDTDIAVITAENLKLVAENWTKYSSKDSFNLHVFNTTGILNWETLRDRMKWHE
jgi:hypothetical protein